MIRPRRPCLGQGFLEIDNKPEFAMSAIVPGRSYLAGSTSGGVAAAIACTLVESAGLIDVDRPTWRATVLHRIPGDSMTRIDDLLARLRL